MICQNCGKEVSDTSKFCAFCGTAVQATPTAGKSVTSDILEKKQIISEESAAQPVSFDDEATVVLDVQNSNAMVEPQTLNGEMNHSEPVPEPIPIVPVQAVAPEPIPVVPMQEGTASSGPAPQTPNMGVKAPTGNAAAPGYEPKKSHTGAVLAVFGIIAVAIVVVIVLLAKLLLGRNKLDSRVFYMKDYELTAITDIKASNPENVQIADIRNGENVGNDYLAELSEDGSYLYYFSDVDSEGETGTLCRIPTGKVKKKESANEKLVEEIDSKVNIQSYTILEDNSVIYIRKSDELTWYNGSESYDLGDCGDSDYQVTDDGKYVVYLDDDTLVATEISKKAVTTEIDDDVESLLSVGNKDFILYEQKHGEDRISLCVAEIGKDPKVIADDIYDYFGVDTDSKSFYYTIAEEKEYSLYDYVVDSYANEDAKAVEPKARDYMDKVKASEAICEYDQEYYSNFEEFEEEELYYYNESYELWEYWNYDNSCYYYYDKDEEQWYSSPDSEALNEAWSKYDDVAERISLRKDLKEESITENYYKLYYYENGKSKEVCTEVNSIAGTDGNATIYTKANVGDKPEAQYHIDEISDTYELRDEIESSDGDDTDSAYYFCNAGAGECEIEGLELDTVYGLLMSENGKTAFIYGDFDDSEYTYTVLSYTVSSSGLGKGNEVSGECYLLKVIDNEFYYYEDVDGDMGTLYVYNGSKSYLVAENICTSDVCVADDGSVIGYSSYDDDSGELAVYDKDGKDQSVAKDVESFTYLGKNCYLLMKDGDLYYMDKKGNEKRLARDVSYYLYPGSEKVDWLW